MASSSAALTPEELREIEELQVENEVLAQEVSQLISTMMTEKERRKQATQQEKDVDSHPSRAYLKEIAALQKDAPILALIKQWRSARQQCAAYSETLEEVRANFVEMKALYEQLTSRPYCREGVLRLQRLCSNSFPCSNIAYFVQQQSCSTQPLSPLSILSWSVDGSLHSHHRCRRRFTLEERIPHIVNCIRECEPDVVALQDSTPEIRDALCGGTPTLANEKADPVAAVGFTCLGSVRNGRCGEVQLFLRSNSKWTATPIHRGAGVSAELSYPASGTSRPVLKAVISNVDLSYRGKSIGQNGELLASPQDSLDGSPFAFSAQNRRAAGQVDPFRFLALQYISKVNRPDILVGNFYMSKNDHLPGYKDAWVLSGSPPQEERTTNTFQSHQLDQQTNYYYFVPSPSGAKKKKKFSGSVAEGSGDEAERAGGPPPRSNESHHGESGDCKGDGGDFLGCREAEVSVSAVGVPLSLIATLVPSGMPEEKTTATASAADSATESKETSPKWVLPKRTVNEGALAGFSSHEPCDAETWLARANQHPLHHDTVHVPEVAGRYQRCFLRHPIARPEGQPVRANARVPLYKQFSSIRVLVPKSFTLMGELGPLEAAWHTAQRESYGKHKKENGQREKQRASDGTSEDGSSQGKRVDSILCTPSDQYPLLVHFTPQ